MTVATSAIDLLLICVLGFSAGWGVRAGFELVYRRAHHRRLLAKLSRELELEQAAFDRWRSARENAQRRQR